MAIYALRVRHTLNDQQGHTVSRNHHADVRLF